MMSVVTVVNILMLLYVYQSDDSVIHRNYNTPLLFLYTKTPATPTAATARMTTAMMMMGVVMSFLTPSGKSRKETEVCNNTPCWTVLHHFTTYLQVSVETCAAAYMIYIFRTSWSSGSCDLPLTLILALSSRYDSFTHNPTWSTNVVRCVYHVASGVSR